MSPNSLSAAADLFHTFRLIGCFLAAFAAASLSACGVSTPGGYVLGTTGYLAEYNRGSKVEISSADRRKLDQLVEEVR